MLCKNCGQALPEEAKFCPACGTKVEAEKPSENAKKFCAFCGAELEHGALFCQSCGVKVKVEEAVEHEPKPPVQTVSNGTLLDSYQLVSLYIGEPKIGVANATGTLSVYDDRLEFKKLVGNALALGAGLIGAIAAQQKFKKDPQAIFPLSLILHMRVGKYAGIYNTLVLEIKDGTVFSLCPAVPASSIPSEIISMLQPYL